MKMQYVLGVALIVAAGAGFVVDRARKQSSIATEPPPTTATEPAPQTNTSNSSALSGKVIETIDVPQYTYLHLDTGSGKVWAAVQTAKVTKGSTVTIADAMKMEQFRSKTLKRTFDVIYFGSLGNSAVGGSAAGLPTGHPDISGSNPLAGGMGQGAVHQDIHRWARRIPNRPMCPRSTRRRARMPLESQRFAARKNFAGKQVRVRGAVVKVTPGINGKTFLHLRDGSGDAAKQDNDLAVTTQAVPKKGDVVTLEGTLQTNVDIGIGYHYPALLEDAKVVNE